MPCIQFAIGAVFLRQKQFYIVFRKKQPLLFSCIPLRTQCISCR